MKNLTPFFSVVAICVAITTSTTGCPVDEVTEPNEPVSSISVRMQEDTTWTAPVTVLGVGSTLTAVAEALDRNNDEVAVPVTWSSSNPTVASVPSSNGKSVTVTGVSPGTATISVSAQGKTASRTLTVKDFIGVADGVVFSSTRDGNSEIYLLGPDGPRNLTQNPATDINPSKHGDRIFFSSNRSGNFEIYSMWSDGTDITRLTTNTVPDYSPSVSSKGKVAFAREVAPERQQIFTMDQTGQGQTNISNNAFHEVTPSWSPDGSRLVYSSDRDRKYGPREYMEVYTMKSDGTDVVRLTVNDNGIDYLPSWGPDGRIAFTTHRSANPRNPADPTCYDQALEIWVMNADGSGLRNLTNSCRGDAFPAWSPGGTALVFLSDRGSATNYAWDLWKILAEGGDAIRLTTTGKEQSPSWMR